MREGVERRPAASTIGQQPAPETALRRSPNQLRAMAWREIPSSRRGGRGSAGVVPGRRRPPAPPKRRPRAASASPPWPPVADMPRIAGLERRAAFPPRALGTARTARRTQCRPEIHHRLREIAGSPFRRQRASESLDLRSRGGQSLFNRMQSRDHPQHVTIDRRRRPIKGDRGNRGRGVAADSRQQSQGRFVFRKTAGVARRDSSCASMQIAHPRVIAEALPSMQNLVQLRRSEIRGAASVSEMTRSTASRPQPWSAAA